MPQAGMGAWGQLPAAAGGFCIPADPVPIPGTGDWENQCWELAVGISPQRGLQWGAGRAWVGRVCWKARRLLSGSWWPWSSVALFGVLHEVVTGRLNGSLRPREILSASPCLGWGGSQLPSARPPSSFHEFFLL